MTDFIWKKEKRHELISRLLFTTLSLQIRITLNRIDRDTTQSVITITIWSVHAAFIYLFVYFSIKVHVQMIEHVQKQQGAVVQSARFSLSTLNSWRHQRFLWLLLSSPLEIRQQNKDVNTRQIHRGPKQQRSVSLFQMLHKRKRRMCLLLVSSLYHQYTVFVMFMLVSKVMAWQNGTLSGENTTARQYSPSYYKDNGMVVVRPQVSYHS